MRPDRLFVRFGYKFFEDPNNPDPSQIIPEECERPKRPRKRKAAAPSL